MRERVRLNVVYRTDMNDEPYNRPREYRKAPGDLSVTAARQHTQEAVFTPRIPAPATNQTSDQLPDLTITDPETGAQIPNPEYRAYKALRASSKMPRRASRNARTGILPPFF